MKTVVFVVVFFLLFASAQSVAIKYLTDRTFCGENTVWTDHYSCEVAYCRNPDVECNPKWRFKGCVCIKGFVRNDLYECVPRDRCGESANGIL